MSGKAGYVSSFTGMKSHLVEYVSTITQWQRGNAYLCPLCGSGSGAKKTAAFFVYDGGTKWKCHACGEGGDLLDLIGKHEGLNKAGSLKRARELFVGMSVLQPQRTDKPTEPEQDFTSFFLEANRHLSETDYHRGITQATLDAFKVGFVAAWRHPKAGAGVPPSPRLIIPVGKGAYLARDTRTGASGQYIKQRVGKGGLFNTQALYQPQPCFLVEGELDALSVIDCGGQAAALGSTANARRFIDLVKKEKPKARLILALDADEAGERCKALIVGELSKAGIPFSVFSFTGGKDANEAMLKDRTAFTEEIKAAAATGAVEEYTQRVIAEEYRRNNSAAAYMDAFQEAIAASVDAPYLKTGFEYLDGVFDGGVMEGLYVIGAGTGAGKTCFCLQIADALAAAGQSVLYFSLEMSKAELMARSISRITAHISAARGAGTSLAKTARQITCGRKWLNYTDTEKEVLNEAFSLYRDFAGNIFFFEGIGNIGTREIKDAIQEHIWATGAKPFCVIDYVQILASPDPRLSDKQSVDRNIFALKQLSRDYHLPIFLISSISRANYDKEVNLASFKESGSLEFTCDAAIAMQGKPAGDFLYDIEAHILKNRHGSKNIVLHYDFDGRFSLFTERERVDAAKR